MTYWHKPHFVPDDTHPDGMRYLVYGFNDENYGHHGSFHSIAKTVPEALHIIKDIHTQREKKK